MYQHIGPFKKTNKTKIYYAIFRKLFKLEETSAGQPWSSQQIQMCGTDVCFNGLVNEYEQNILSFGEDDDG